MSAGAQSLRHRRNRTEDESSESDEAKALLPSKNDTRSESMPQESLDGTGGYKLEPLVERSMLMRLDVAPFLLGYCLLIGMEYLERQDILPMRLFDILFPATLVGHLALFFLQQWDVRIRAAVGFQTTNHLHSMTHCLVEAPHVDKHHSAHDDGVVPAIKADDGAVIVKFRDVVFRSPVDNTKEDWDMSLWTMEQGSDPNLTPSPMKQRTFHRLRYPIDLPLEFYKQWKGHDSITTLVRAQNVYGPNDTPIDLPPFLALLQEQVVAPFFLFQVLCVILWSLDEYWYYAIFTFFALLMFESTVAYNRLQSLLRLRSHTTRQHRPIYVYRPGYPPGQHAWLQVLVSELVPGDIVSCKHYSIPRGRNKRRHPQEQQFNTIPADILVLSGDAVVDEALLTGESIPQLKGALGDLSDVNLNLNEHKEYILFGGTTLLVANGNESSDQSILPPSPDGGVIGVVLRTGFETAQGSLLRTMAHTQKSVDGIHTKDTYVFIFLLLCCAVASAGMVLQEGWNDPTRNRFRLLLHVIIIVTSVVPPELPMELSLAVTNSVTSLMRDCQVYCTEVFRIPLAGQVTICCFDKTGTLTSDEMQLVGVRYLDDSTGKFHDTVTADSELPWHVTRIMAACHSLALNAGTGGGRSSDNIVGDPLEKAVLKGTGYHLIQNNALRAAEPAAGQPSTILVMHRFRFSSKLKRMSVVVREDTSSTTWVLSKGAPETIKTLLDAQSIPPNYDEISMHHMSLGQRVLAIAYRELTQSEVASTGNSWQSLNRESVEKDLKFAGFLLLDCPVKPDSKTVIAELTVSGHTCFMITGDALLTAASVARQVGIIPNKEATSPALYQILRISGAGAANSQGLENFAFVRLPNGSRDDGKAAGVLDDTTLSTDTITKAKDLVANGRVALCLSGETLDQLGQSALESQVGPEAVSRMDSKNEGQLLFHPNVQSLLKELVPSIAVFARHAPRQKEAIIAAFNAGGHNTLMCGDGTNDVGALRRAHVGISLISAPQVEAKQRAASATLSRERLELKKAKKEGKGRAKASSAFEESLRQLREAQEELDSVELGDASIASPFTSRTVSIKCCKDVLQQGRCTLVTMLQIYKILGVNCLVNATVLSKLFLHGVKNGDRQLTILGIGVAALFFFVTRGKPLRTLSVTRPPASVLCAQALLSIALQFLVHMSAILLSAQAALAFVDPYDPSMIPDGPFNPNTLNSCTFLISAIATVNTFAINYRGEPFMESLWQNKVLLRSLQVCYLVLFGCALEVFPPLNDLLQLTEMPILDGTELMFVDGHETAHPLLYAFVRAVGFPSFLCIIMLIDTFLAWTVERTLLQLFEGNK